MDDSDHEADRVDETNDDAEEKPTIPSKKKKVKVVTAQKKAVAKPTTKKRKHSEEESSDSKKKTPAKKKTSKKASTPRKTPVKKKTDENVDSDRLRILKHYPAEVRTIMARIMTKYPLPYLQEELPTNLSEFLMTGIYTRPPTDTSKETANMLCKHAVENVMQLASFPEAHPDIPALEHETAQTVPRLLADEPVTLQLLCNQRLREECGITLGGPANAKKKTRFYSATQGEFNWYNDRKLVFHAQLNEEHIQTNRMLYSLAYHCTPKATRWFRPFTQMDKLTAVHDINQGLCLRVGRCDAEFLQFIKTTQEAVKGVGGVIKQKGESADHSGEEGDGDEDGKEDNEEEDEDGDNKKKKSRSKKPSRAKGCRSQTSNAKYGTFHNIDIFFVADGAMAFYINQDNKRTSVMDQMGDITSYFVLRRDGEGGDDECGDAYFVTGSHHYVIPLGKYWHPIDGVEPQESVKSVEQQQSGRAAVSLSFLPKVGKNKPGLPFDTSNYLNANLFIYIVTGLMYWSTRPDPEGGDGKVPTNFPVEAAQLCSVLGKKYSKMLDVAKVVAHNLIAMRVGIPSRPVVLHELVIRATTGSYVYASSNLMYGLMPNKADGYNLRYNTTLKKVLNLDKQRWVGVGVDRAKVMEEKTAPRDFLNWEYLRTYPAPKHSGVISPTYGKTDANWLEILIASSPRFGELYQQWSISGITDAEDNGDPSLKWSALQSVTHIINPKTRELLTWPSYFSELYSSADDGSIEAEQKTRSEFARVAEELKTVYGDPLPAVAENMKTDTKTSSLSRSTPPSPSNSKGELAESKVESKEEEEEKPKEEKPKSVRRRVREPLT